MRTRRRHFFSAIGAAVLSLIAFGCAFVQPHRLALAGLNLIAPGGYTLAADIAYGDLQRQKLDIYMPKADAGAPRKVLVYFYGGYWQQGDKESYKFLAAAMAALGYVVVVPDYRLYPGVRFPAFLEDCAAALRFVHAHAGEYGGDAEAVYVMGHSAGGYNTVMMGLDPRYLYENGAPPKWLRGVIGIAGVYDFLPLGEGPLQGIFGQFTPQEQTQPVHYARADAPPMLLLTGDADDVVYPRNSARLEERLKQAGGDAKRIVYAGANHYNIILALVARNPDYPIRQDVRAFIEAH